MFFTMPNKILAPGDRTVPWLSLHSKRPSYKPIKYLCSINRFSLPETTPADYQFKYIDINSVDSGGNRLPSEYIFFIDAPSRARRIVRNEDVIISTVRTYLKAISYIEEAGNHLVCSTGFAVITPGSEVFSKFLFYWVCSEWFVNEIVARSVGVSYPAINAIEIGNLPFPVINVEEQQAIADYLDQETAKIDLLVEKKKRLIELLEEQRTAMITNAVTKGLNPDVEMKDSGVEWLGEIPAHWEVKKLKYIALTRFSGVDKHSKDGETPIRLCNYTDVYNSNRISSSQPFIEATATRNEIFSFSLHKDDIVVTKDSEDWKDIAVPSYVGEDCPGVICGYHLALIKPFTTIVNGKFLYWSFRTININHQFVIAATGITRFGLGKDDFCTSLFLLPPIEEQQAIADYLDKETTRIDNLISKINQAIEKLQEYRSALITAAVTGKIDVRQHVS